MNNLEENKCDSGIIVLWYLLIGFFIFVFSIDMNANRPENGIETNWSTLYIYLGVGAGLSCVCVCCKIIDNEQSGVDTKTVRISSTIDLLEGSYPTVNPMSPESLIV